MRLLLILLLLPTMAIAKPRMVFPGNVLSVITADWNGDGQKDRAVLINNPVEGTADLYIYIGADGGFFEQTYAPNIVWSGSLWGQQPSLELNDAGSLLVLSTNHGMGRIRWFQALTIAYRDENFVMAGFTYDYYDSIDPEDTGECDINLLTRSGIRMLASEWNIDIFPEDCL